MEYTSFRTLKDGFSLDERRCLKLNSFSPSGNALGAAISVLPATAAYAFLPGVSSQELSHAVVLLAAVWAVSYLGINSIRRVLNK
jgi:hypothetical protein